MFRKAVAFLVAYSFFANSVWSLTGPGVRVNQTEARMNWNIAKSAGNLPSALTSSGLNSVPTSSSVTTPAITTASSILKAASVPFDGGSSNCTVHTTQPSSDSDGGDSDQGYGSYARHDYKYGSDDHASGITPAVVASGVTIFGPQTFVRTTGPPNEFDQTITVPAWIAQPFYLHVVNGDSSGNHRVSSATVSINGMALLVPSDFNQQVASADCAVTLTVPTSALHVELASKPGSFLTINLLGQNQDHTPPTLSITAPANGSSINTTTPHIALSYSDVKGATEPAASGVNVPSLKVLLDGVDRTSLFTERPNDASADVPSSLALSQGSHTITATIQDNAGNTATATSQFQVVTQSGLVLQIVQPPSGAIFSNLSVPVQITYSDTVSINTSTLKVTVNGVDRTSAFTVTASGATATVTGQQGANQIVASISDVSSQQATTSAAFNIDTVPPTITILHPTPGSTHGSSAVEYSVQYTDDQALDLTSLKISVDGTALAVTPGPSTASGTVTLADGNHTLTALIKDKAGNQATASSTFSVDTTAPSIHIVQPAPGAIQNVASLQVQVTYGDNENINTGSLKITVDGTDETSFFTVTATSASASLPGPFGEGSHSIAAQIADQTGNVGQTSSTFVVDTIKPALTIVSPVGPINTASPSALAQYSDSGTGINTSSVHVFVDGSEVTAGFSIGNASVTGTLAGLSEGPHQLRVTVADRAGNGADLTVSFLVDVTPPAVSFASPANNVFINNTQPLVALNYSDSGSGINQATIHIFLQAGSNPETEITSAFTVGASQASGTIGTPTPLVPGTYHLRAQIADNAGNSSTATSAFQVDTQPPTYTIHLPAANSFLNTATPALLVTYQDDASGVDPSQFAIRVDGIDRTNRLTVTATSASGTLLAADALADGTHQVEVTVVDRAGNSAPVVPQSFLVDTTPPTIAISTPVNGVFTNNNLFPISVSYSDSGSGIDITKFQLTIDGVDQTAQFTITPTGATGTPAAVLPNGLHTVTATIKDLAGNPATATAAIAVNTVPPQITITQPANGVFTNATSLVVTGTVVDAAPVTVTVAGTAVPVQNGSFTSAGITLGTNATQTIPVVATDAAGNSSTVTLTINIDRTPPTITGAINPPPNAAGWNNTAVTVSFTCSDSGSGIATCPAPVPVMTEGANQAVTGTAVDNAGNTAQATVTVNIDKTPPLISANPTPAPNAAGWNNTDVVISYLCSDSLSGISICPPPVTVSTEGAAENFSAQATDQAGNTSGVTTTLNIDKTPPVVTATAAPGPNGAGWNNTNVTVTFACTDSLSGVANCPSQQLVTTEGQNQNISRQATDVAGNVGTGSITLNIDKTPPTIVQLSTPDTISRLHSGQISVTVNDNFFVSQVVISVNGTSLGAFTSAPYQAALQVPAGANPGDTLTVTAVATDEAGNTQSASRTVRVAADGVIVGQVLSDATSFPIQGAVVQTISATGSSDQTDDHGRYSLLASDPHLFLSASSASPSTTTVEREVFVQDGVGTVPVDARLTPLAAPLAIGSAGGTLAAGNISITVPAGAVGDGTTFQLTPLSGQGLPGLLPLGWSPLAAFDFRASSQAMNLPATITQLPNMVVHLAAYNPALHAWTAVATNLQVVSGGVAVALPSSATYALVVPDVVIPPITVPDPGNALPGISMQLLDTAATSSGTLSPAILPPSGGTSTATLGVQTTAAVPSGTVIQANVSETFSLTSGDVVSEETRSEDIVIYNALAPTNSTLGAQFAVAPSHKYTNAQLLTGKVHLDILAGREGVRGQPGGSNPVTVSDGVATLSVPGGALSQDTAINVQSISLENFVPTNGSIGALQEILVDFSGEMLNTAGQLSISSNGLNPAHTFFLTQVQRIDGIPHIVLVALAQINGSSLTSVATPGLPGITQGGEYVFYDVSAPVGFVQGIVSSSAGPVQALVQTDSLPVVSITGANGQYIVPAIAGTANLKANSPHTNLAGSASVQVAAGQTTQTNILLSGTVTSAVVAPADGTLGVPVSTTITITTTAALNPQSISQANLVLLKGTATSGTPIPLQPFVLSTSGTVLSFAPVSNLSPATQYTIQVAGLADTFGGAVVVPVSSFTTKAVAALNFDPNAITFGFPDANGNIQATAPANSLPPGTKILIIDQTSGLVLSLTALNDGSVSGNFPGTINDILQVTVTDPNGAATSFTRNQFVAADGTTAVGSGGGTVSGPGNTGLIIPQGALTKATTFKLTPLDQTAFPQLPSWAGLNFASGLHVDAPDMPSFNQEVKLAFPVPPNAPPNAFYYVYRRLKDQNGKTYFETIDHAFVQGTGANAQVVTASPPFCGYHNPIGNFNIAVAASSGSFPGGSIFTPVTTPFQDFILMFDIAQIDPNQPGIASPGLIVGLVQQTVPAVLGQSAQTTQPYIDNVQISLDSHPEQVATYDPKCSTFTIFDPQLGGGTRTITATARATLPDGSTQNTTVLHATVDEVNGIQVDDATFAIFAGLEHQYRNIGRVTLTFPPTTPPPPPPQLSIHLFTLDPNGHRVPAHGVLPSGTNIVIAFQSQLTVQGASISGTQLSVSTPDTAPEVTDGQPESLLLTARANGTFPLGSAGTYTVTATAVDPASLTRVSASQSILVVAPGGDNNSTIACIAAAPPAAPTSGCTLPKVIDAVPLNGATGVSPSVFPQITFNEPVTHVPANIVLADHTGTPVPVQLIGIRPFDPNNPNANPVANPLQASDVITSLTIQPLFGLKYNETYSLTLNANSTNGCVDSNGNPAPVPLGSTLIIDQNQPPTGPLCLEPFPKPGDPPFKFATFGPQELGGTSDHFSSTRPVIIGNRAFLGERLGVSSAGLGSVDITDPSNPIDKGVSASFIGLALDIAGQAASPVTGGPLVAVASGQPGIELVLPSNVWIYDVSNPDAPVRVAAVSATTSTTQDGTLLRVFMKDQFLYTSTFMKGLQVIDLKAAKDEYDSVFSHNPTQFGQAITTEGNGFATDTVVNSIPLYAGNYQNTPPGPPYTATMRDVKAADYVTAPPPPGSPDGTPGTTQTLIVATGRLPLVIADPQQTGTSGVIYPSPDGGTVPNGLPGAGLPTSDPSPLSFQVQNSDNSTSTYTLTTGSAVALGTLSTTDSQGNSNSEQIAVLIGTGTAPALPDGTAAAGPLFVVNMVATGDPSHPVKPVVQGVVGLPVGGTDVALHGNLAVVATGLNKILLVNLVDPTHPVFAGEIDAPPGSIFGDRLAVTDDGLIATSSFNSTTGGLETADLGGRVPRPGTGHCPCERKPAQPNAVGLPINVSNGNVYVDQSDYSLPGLGGGIRLARTWNSQWNSSSPVEISGTFGHSWRSTFDERLVIPIGTAGAQPVKYWLSDGTAWFFQLSQSGNSYTVSSPLDEHATLQPDATQTNYTIIFADGSKKTFNANGYLMSIIDRNGNKTTVNYDAASRIANVTDAAGRVLTFNYGAARQVQSIQDAVGVVATYSYDTATHLTKVTYADGSSVNMSYDALDLLLNVTDGNGKLLEGHTYDGARRGLSSTRANGVGSVTVSYANPDQAVITNSQNVTTTYGSGRFGGQGLVTSVDGPGCDSCGGRNKSAFSYDSSGNQIASTDALDHTTKYGYDAQGHLLSVSQSDGNGNTITTSRTYNSFGEVLTTTDPLGNVTTNTYDAHGNLLTVTTPAQTSGGAASVKKFAYDVKGELTQITDPLGNVTRLSYTPVGLIATATDAQGNVTTYGYDARGNRTSLKDALGNTTTFAYDALNRLTTITYPDSTTTKFGYDSRGRRTGVTDQNGHITKYGYDDADRQTSVTDAAGNVTSYSYDPENNLTSITDANDHTTSFSYDALGRVTQTTFPSSLVETYGYDAVGNLANKTDRKGQTINYTYDALNRLVTRTYPDKTAVNYVYDSNSRLTQVTDATGTYSFTFDNMGRLTGTATQYAFLTSRSFSTSYGYDAASNRVTFIDSEGGSTSYAYDTLNRLTKLTPPSDFATALPAGAQAGFSFSYDALSRRTQLTRPNRVTTNYTYDNLSRLLSVLHQLGTATLDGATYTVDNAGNRTSKRDQLANITTNYGYDAIYELLSATQSSTTTESYSYDAVGNRLSSPRVASSSYNALNELTSNSNAIYTYDNNGNTLTKTDSTGTAQYAWDFENRLTTVTLPGSGATVSFKYDPFGRRVYKSSSSGTSIYLFDGPNVAEEVDQSGSVLARYTQDTGIDQVRAELRSGTTSYYEQDGLNSVTSLSDATGALAQTYTFDSFGNQTASSGSLTNPFRYTGRDLDSETNLYYYRARYFDPASSRFISEDPKRFQASENFYSYVSNSPTGFVDPFGWAKCKSGACADCPSGRWITGSFTGEAYASVGIVSGGGIVFTGVFLCTSNATFNVPFYTVCGFGVAGLSPRPPLTKPPKKLIGVGGGVGAAGLTCTGMHCKEDLQGTEKGWFAQVGPAYYFREGGASGGKCQGGGAGFDLGLSLGGFKCTTSTSDDPWVLSWPF